MANDFKSAETISTKEFLRFIAPVTDMTVKDTDDQDIVTVALSVIEDDTLNAKQQYGDDYVTVQVFAYYYHENEDVTTNILCRECIATKDYLRRLLARIDVFRQLISIGKRPSATLFADTDTAVDVSIQYSANRPDPYRIEIYDGSNMLFIPVHPGFRIEPRLGNIR